MNSLGLNKNPKDTRVVVAMSGGVDSSVVAAMLKAEGYDVVGITLQLYDHGAMLAKKGACCAGADIHDARMVAEKIGIPHYVLNYESKFREAVMEDFADTYLAGQTPIPCVKCNQSVKFRDLLNMARDLDADALATGHYVKRVEGQAGAELHRAADAGKDQSYFLFATTREQLSFLRFPLGALSKEQTRALAQEYALPVAAKPDSQDICFVPDGDYAKVVAKLRPDACRGGEIVHVDGKVLGTHEGIIHYTVGQRRGLRLSAEEPLYVIRLDAKEARVIVGPKEALMTRTFLVRDFNWLTDGVSGEVKVKLRSTASPVDAEIRPAAEGRAEVTLLNPREAVSPGQACVAYAGSRVLGGGWIAAA